MRSTAALILTACLALVPIATASAEPDLALRVEGYLGYSNLDFGFVDLDAFQGGGTGSVSAVFEQFYLQGDLFGDVMDFDQGFKAKNVGPGVHIGGRDPSKGSVGIVGTYNDLDLGDGDLDIFRVGFEGEAYLDRLTLGLNAGLIDLDGDAHAYIEGLLAFYPMENARLNFRIGAVGVDDSDPLINLGLGVEFLANQTLAPFMRWEASLPDDFGDVFQYSLVAGLTFYWGAETPTLQGYDRSRFKQSCSGVLLAGRIC